MNMGGPKYFRHCLSWVGKGVASAEGELLNDPPKIMIVVRTAAWLGMLAVLVALSRGEAGVPPAPAKDRSAPLSPPTPQEYTRFALQHDGDPGLGAKLFADEGRLGCTRCHSIDGRGGRAGPDLATVGDQFSRADLIDAVLHPSAVIAVGYGTTIVETRSGEEYSGVLKQVANDGIELACGDGRRRQIPKAEITEQRTGELSLMPEGLAAGLALAEFTDLIEFLASRKEPAHGVVTHRGMPEDIPVMDPPVSIRPFLSESLPVPRAGGVAGRRIQSGLVWFAQMPGDRRSFLALDQSGIIWRIEKNLDGERRSVFVDLTPEVFSASGPNGLLGLAFHPRFHENRKYFLKHQVLEAGRMATLLVERTASADGHVDSGRPSRRLLKIEAVAEHHNGGCIQFGPDGYLYFGMGDSAPNDDPQGHGQNLGLLFGKMLRIDVDHRDSGLEYAVPADNPFRDRAGARPEIWAWGLREPWRFSFDAAMGDLWVADLGQERGDEVSLVRRGENHGWNVYQGFELFSNRHRREGVAYSAPLFSTRRRHGSAIMGGLVYRGDPTSTFYGVYIFGDYTSKRIWGLTQEGGALRTVRQLAVCPQPITAFAADAAGQILVVGQQGMIYEIDLRHARFEEARPAGPE